MKKILIGLLLLGVGYLYFIFSPKGHLLPFYHQIYSPKAYQELLERQKIDKKQLEKTDSLQQEMLFVQHARQLFRFWYGTTWDMNGTSQTPGKGKIACGYFVTTVLEDMGVSLARIRLSQMSSEKMIENLVSKKNSFRYIGIPFADFMEKMRQHGQGLYVVGLDTHTGFLVVDSNEILFIHSSQLSPSCVLEEDAALSATLQRSNYRLIGKLSKDKALLENWIKE